MRAGPLPPLGDVLRLLRPPRALTLLLRAGLLPDGMAGRAWSAWLLEIGDPKAFFARDRAGVRRHLPLLYHRLSRDGVSLDGSFGPYLRTAYMREELRYQRFREALGEALSVLARAGIDVIVTKGAALAETVYPEPALRHCHDVDVIVEDPAGALDVLLAAGFTRQSATCARHASGLPVELHETMFASPFHPAPIAEVRARSAVTAVAGAPARVMAPADMLVHVLGHASLSARRDSLCWVTDAWLLLQREPDLDWTAAADLARCSRMALPVWAMLEYLADEMNAPVPAAAIAAIAAAGAASYDRRAAEAALEGLRRGRGAGVPAMLRAAGWRSRLVIGRWLVAPSPAFLRWSRRDSAGWRLVWCYVRRPAGFVRRRVIGP